jgi:hypothetical protein
MQIIADKRIHEQAKFCLQKFGEIIWLETSNITEKSISGHPDIFFCKTPNSLILAPNLPNIYKDHLSKNNIHFVEGRKNVGEKYPDAAIYNAVITDRYLIHKTNITDEIILNDGKDHQQISVRQGFTRCSLLPLKENHFITSDHGIFKTLTAKGFQVLLVSSDEIILPGHPHGFFGGACGVHENKIFILGNLVKYNDGEKVRIFISALGYEIIELYDGPLFDGGSLMFIGQ